MSVKAKPAPENQSAICAYYYYYSLQTLTIRLNHSDMIVHTWAKHYREDCFSFLIVSSLKCDSAPSAEDKNRCLFLYECNMNEDFGVKMSQKYDHSMICQTAKTLLQAQNTQRLQKIFF